VSVCLHREEGHAPFHVLALRSGTVSICLWPPNGVRMSNRARQIGRTAPTGHHWNRILSVATIWGPNVLLCVRIGCQVNPINFGRHCQTCQLLKEALQGTVEQRLLSCSGRPTRIPDSGPTTSHLGMRLAAWTWVEILVSGPSEGAG
jgi:hypothetical protein